MTEPRADNALKSSTAALVVAVACIAMFLPPLDSHTTGSVLRPVLLGLVLATAVLLHWVFLGIAARRLGRSVVGWVALSVLLFPVGGGAALVLLHWLHAEGGPPAATA